MRSPLAGILLMTAGIYGCATLPEGRVITVETEPAGAAIIVDGAYVGDSPVSVSIHPA